MQRESPGGDPAAGGARAHLADAGVTVTDLAALTPDPDNANRHTERGAGLLEDTLRTVGAGRSILVDADNVVIAGNGVLDAAAAAGIERVRIIDTDGTEIIAVRRTNVKLASRMGRELALRDNTAALRGIDLDADVIARQAEAYEIDLGDAGISDAELAAMRGRDAATDPTARTDDGPATEPAAAAAAPRERKRRGLAAKFTWPALSVLDGRADAWAERKRQWVDLGVYGGPDATRDNAAEVTAAGGDPVLAELLLRWFLPGDADCHVLAPFGGDPTPALVACQLGHHFTGLESDGDALERNADLAAGMGLAPRWIRADAADLEASLAPGATFDLAYCDVPDASGSDYGRHLERAAAAITRAAARLRDGRFLILRAADWRDGGGAYRRTAADLADHAAGLGLHLLNEFAHLQPLGPVAGMQARAFGATRRAGRAHQVALALFKGDPRDVKNLFPLEVPSAGVPE